MLKPRPIMTAGFLPMRHLKSRLDKKFISLLNVSREFTGALLSEALTTDEKTWLTIRLYNLFHNYRSGALPPWEERLAGWEEAWFKRRLPKPPARVLVGGCGGGREVLALVDQGFHVDAFDPAPKLMDSSLQSAQNRARISLFRYEDLSASVLEGTAGPASLFASERYDAVLLGWGSLTHVLEVRQQFRLFRALNMICVNGPILTSFWCTSGYAPQMSNAGSACLYGQTIGRKLNRLRGIEVDASPGLNFAFHRGFGYIFSPTEIENLASTINRQLVWEHDETTYAHVTFLPR